MGKPEKPPPKAPHRPHQKNLRQFVETSRRVKTAPAQKPQHRVRSRRAVIAPHGQCEHSSGLTLWLTLSSPSRKGAHIRAEKLAPAFGKSSSRDNRQTLNPKP